MGLFTKKQKRKVVIVSAPHHTVSPQAVASQVAQLEYDATVRRAADKDYAARQHAMRAAAADLKRQEQDLARRAVANERQQQANRAQIVGEEKKVHELKVRFRLCCAGQRSLRSDRSPSLWASLRCRVVAARATSSISRGQKREGGTLALRKDQSLYIVQGVIPALTCSSGFESSEERLSAL